MKIYYFLGANVFDPSEPKTVEPLIDMRDPWDRDCWRQATDDEIEEIVGDLAAKVKELIDSGYIVVVYPKVLTM